MGEGELDISVGDGAVTPRLNSATETICLIKLPYYRVANQRFLSRGRHGLVLAVYSTTPWPTSYFVACPVDKYRLPVGKSYV